ncbi:MAG: Ig-like domain-containing protein [Actinomycetota bacterium]|nr:Ig-like domain-containing protein [Actinomycetota bacterium]
MSTQRRHTDNSPNPWRHGGTGLDYESYARWLRVGTVVFGLGAAIATGSGVAAASTDSDSASGSSSSQSDSGTTSEGSDSGADTEQDIDTAASESADEPGDAAGEDSEADVDDDDLDSDIDDELDDELDEDLDEELEGDLDSGDEVEETGDVDDVIDDEPVIEEAASGSTDNSEYSGDDSTQPDAGESDSGYSAAAVSIEEAVDESALSDTIEQAATEVAVSPARSSASPEAVQVVSVSESNSSVDGARQQEAINARSIVTDVLHWVGLGPLAADLPIAPTPVPLLVQALWQLVRDSQYTYNNQRPTVAPTVSGPGPDGTITGNLNAVDYDDTNLTYIVVSGPGHGTVTVGPDGEFTYTPDAGTTATTDTFTVTVDDQAGNPAHVHGLLESNGIVGPRQAVVTVSLTGEDLPTEGRQSDAVNLNTIVTDVLHWVGLGRLTPRLSIPETTVPTAVESLWRLVREVQYRNENQRPTAEPVIFGQDEAGTVTGSINAVDYDDITLSYSVVGDPDNGTVTIDDNGRFVYTPTTGMAATGGTDTFVVDIDDNVGTPVNRAGLLDRLGLARNRRVVVVVRVAPIGPQPVGGGYSAGAPDPDTGTVEGAIELDNAGAEPLAYSADPVSSAGGTITIDEQGRFTYTPTAAARHAAAADDATPDQLSDTFEITATDEFGGVTTVMVTVGIAPANADPDVQATITSRDEDGAITGTVAGDDPDGDPLTYSAPATSTLGGTVTVDAETGEFSYTPTAEARHDAAADDATPDQLTDTFQITATDGHGGVSTTTVTVALVPANGDLGVPVVSVSAPNPGTGSVRGVVSVDDPDGDTPVFSAPATTGNGGILTVDPETGEFIYTPSEQVRHEAAADDATPGQLADTFTITVTDGHGSTVVVPVTVPISPANTAPVVDATQVSEPNPDTGVVTVSIDAADPDGDPLVLSADPTSALGGTVTADPETIGGFRYTPAEDTRLAAAVGGPRHDTFTMTVTDGHGGTTSLTVTVDIAPLYTVPTVDDISASSPDPDTGTVTVSIVASDPDGGELTYDAVSAKGGTITADPAVTGGFTYTPTDAARHAAAADDATADQLTDTLQITVTDTDGNTTTVAVTVDIAPANVAPTATYTVDSFNNGDFELDFEGWTIIDSQVWLDGTHMIAGWPTPVDPTTAPDGGTETAPDRATYLVYIEDGRVVLLSTLGGVPNTPEGSRIGGVVHGPALVSDAPVRINAGATIQFDWEASGGGDAYDVLGYVLDVDTGATSIILDATGATPGATQPVTQVNHTVTETGNFVFVFVAGSWDATAGHVAGARLSVDNIRVLNNSTSVDGEVAGLVSGHDADNDTLTYSAPTTTALGGTVVIDSATGEFTYTPTSEARHAAAGGGPQEDTFDVTVDDGHGGVTTVSVTAPIDPANAAPEAAVTVGDPDTTTGAVTGTLAVTDPDGDGVAVNVPDPDARGAVVFDYTTGEFTFTPTATARHDAAAEDATADQLTDTFHFTVTDGHGGTLTVPITVDIVPANAGPAVGDVTAGVPDPDTGVVTVSVVASDPDNDSLTFSADALSALGGTITTDTSTTGGFVYTPTEAARQIATTDPTQRSDSFDVTVADGHGGTVTVAVTVAVAPLAPTNSAPTVDGLAVGESDPDTGVIFLSVQADDADGDQLVYTAASAKGGTVTADPAIAGGFIYTPSDEARHAAAADDATPDDLVDTVTITVSDAHGDTTTVAVAVGIAPANTAPSVSYGLTGLGAEVTGVVTATDADSDAVVFTAGAPEYGTVTIDAGTGEFTYTAGEVTVPTVGDPAEPGGFDDGTLDGWEIRGSQVDVLSTSTIGAWTVSAADNGSFAAVAGAASGWGSRILSNELVNLRINNADRAQLTGLTQGGDSRANSISTSVHLEPGIVYSMSWNHLGDNVGGREGSLTTLAPVQRNTTATVRINGHEQEYAILGSADGIGDYAPAQPSTPTGWQTVTYEVSEAADYILGFVVYAEPGMPAPNLFVDNQPGTTALEGIVFDSPLPTSDSFLVTVDDGHGGVSEVDVTVPLTPPANML